MNNQSGDTTIINEAVTSRVQPIWIVLGAAAVMFCAGISICLAVSGLGLNFLLSGESEGVIGDRPTQFVAEVPTVQATTINVPTSVPLPDGSTTLAPPPLSPNPVSVSIDISAPAQAVQSYYQAVDANRYDISWPLLSNHFKDLFNCCAPNYNYSGYVNWWDSVDRVELRNVETVSQTGDRAIVYMELHYTMRSGGQSVDRSYIHLVYDPAAGGWLFDNKTDTV
jgi:hypothetical protein